MLLHELVDSKEYKMNNNTMFKWVEETDKGFLRCYHWYDWHEWSNDDECLIDLKDKEVEKVYWDDKLMFVMQVNLT